jgi:peptidoglycan hydrolase-like protein with peptidoglycan-binding domain
VREAQRLLGELGFEVGAADGVAGTRTRNAVLAFERAHGYDGGGRIDNALLGRLRSIVDAGGPADTQSVREAQQRLLERGYRPGPADGLMGAQTRAAIAAFQRDEKLEPSGELDLPTIARLRGEPEALRPDARLLREVQTALAERGFDPGPPDGAMGPRTRAAIAEFRRAEELPEASSLDVAVLRRLGLAAGE